MTGHLRGHHPPAKHEFIHQILSCLFPHSTHTALLGNFAMCINQLTVVLGAEVVIGLELNNPPSSSDSVLSENRPPDLLGGTCMK